MLLPLCRKCSKVIAQRKFVNYVEAQISSKTTVCFQDVQKILDEFVNTSNGYIFDAFEVEWALTWFRGVWSLIDNFGVFLGDFCDKINIPRIFQFLGIRLGLILEEKP